MKPLTLSNNKSALTLRGHYTRQEAINLWGLSAATFHRHATQPDFPKPIKVGRLSFYEKKTFNQYLKNLRRRAA